MISAAPSGKAKRRTARDDVLDAAERLLRADNSATFSMRELAAEAGVSFATPFNQFGNKAAIMQALSARRIDLMTARYLDASIADDAVDRLLAAAAIAVSVLLDAPDVSRAVIGSLGAPTLTPGAVSAHSRALWSLALGDLKGLVPTLWPVARARLPEQLALVFRGCVSFWVAGEIHDEDLQAQVQTATALALLAFTEARCYRALLAKLSVL